MVTGLMTAMLCRVASESHKHPPKRTVWDWGWFTYLLFGVQWIVAAYFIGVIASGLLILVGGALIVVPLSRLGVVLPDWSIFVAFAIGGVFGAYASTRQLLEKAEQHYKSVHGHDMYAAAEAAEDFLRNHWSIPCQKE
jgi:hypothetical protein